MKSCSECDKPYCVLRGTTVTGCVDLNPSPAWFACMQAAGIIKPEELKLDEKRFKEITETVTAIQDWKTMLHKYRLVRDEIGYGTIKTAFTTNTGTRCFEHNHPGINDATKDYLQHCIEISEGKIRDLEAKLEEPKKNPFRCKCEGCNGQLAIWFEACEDVKVLDDGSIDSADDPELAAAYVYCTVCKTDQDHLEYNWRDLRIQVSPFYKGEYK